MLQKIIAVLQVLGTNFRQAHQNFLFLISLFTTLATNVKAANDAAKVAFDSVIASLSASIDSRIQGLRDLIANTEIAVFEKLKLLFIPIQTEMDMIRSGNAKIVRFVMNTALPELTVDAILVAALGVTNEVVKANSTYLLEFVGDSTGVQLLSNGGTPEEMSGGEKYLINTGANGEVLLATKFANPVEEYVKQTDGIIQAIFDGITEITVQNATDLQEQAAAIAQVQAALAALNAPAPTV